MRRFALLLACVSLPLSAARAHASPSTVTVVSIKSSPRTEKPAPRIARLRRPSVKSVKKPLAPPAELVALNTHESFELRPNADGGFGRATMRALAHFLRCHHTQRVHAISERLARLLYTTASHFDFARIEVIAGYRAPKVARAKGNPKSPHKQGLACDFRVAGVTNEVVRDYVRTLPRTGVGYYPNSGFVHLDSRDVKSAFWVDYSGPGERARYSPTPDADVRRMAEEADTVDDAVEQPIDPEREPDPEGANPQRRALPRLRTPNLPALEPSTREEDE